MFSIKQVSDNSLTSKNINAHKNILIIGTGATNYKLNQIVYFNSTISIESLYGASELSEAYSVAKKFGLKDIFILNIQNKLDYISILDVLAQHDFAYIIPLGFNFSDEFYDPIEQRIRTYTELYLSTLGETNNSTIIVTDQKADLYSDMDAFINTMEGKILDFKSKSVPALNHGNNLIFVANNLVDYPKASLALGCALCSTDIGQYPYYNFGEPIFDIDDTDIWQQEFVYFKKNTNTYTSVENLNNFRNVIDEDKIVTIDMVIKYIERELDLSYFSGKLFTEYIRIEIYKLLSKFFVNNSDKLVSYKIKAIDFVEDGAGSGSIVNVFSIHPINSIEEFDVVVEV